MGRHRSVADAQVNAQGWLLSAMLVAACFLPALGTRSQRAKRILLVVGSVAALAISVLAISASASTSEGFLPSGAGWAFILIGIPLGAAMGGAGLALMITKPTRLGTVWRVTTAAIAFAAPPALMALYFGPW